MKRKKLRAIEEVEFFSLAYHKGRLDPDLSPHFSITFG